MKNKNVFICAKKEDKMNRIELFFNCPFKRIRTIHGCGESIK